MVRLFTYIGRNYLRTKHKRPTQRVNNITKKYKVERNN